MQTGKVQEDVAFNPVAVLIAGAKRIFAPKPEPAFNLIFTPMTLAGQEDDSEPDE
jgi:hypothetical protein